MSKTFEPEQQDLFGAIVTNHKESASVTISIKSAKSYKIHQLYNLDIDELRPDSNQVRKYFDTEELAALEKSIKELGIINPVNFRVDSKGRCVIVAGERRWRAAQQAGMKKIPAICLTGDPELISLVENVNRSALNPIELSEAIEATKQNNGWVDTKLQELFGWAPSTISEYRSLRKLPDIIRDDCRMRNDVPLDVLVLIARFDDETKMVETYWNLIDGSISRKEIKQMRSKETGSTPKLILSLQKKISKLTFDGLSNEQKITTLASLDSIIESIQQLKSQINVTGEI